MKKWVLADFDKSNAARIAKGLKLPAIPSIVLDTMKFESDEELVSFLDDDAELTNPFLITDMDLAVMRITDAIESGERICVYGDYDADGVTSTALLYSYLKSIGADVIYYIPSRETEGYGLNNGAIDILHEKNVGLIVTVDNGISAYNEVEYSNSLGIDVVVTDHHTPPEQLPNAAAVVDPHRRDDLSSFKHFSGVGLAFKLVMAMEDDDLDMEKLYDLYSDIAAVGTIGDVVSLTGENRILVKEGLKRINSGNRPGIAELRRVSGCDKKDVSAGSVAFTLVPRINAGGRLGLSSKSVELLLTDDREKAERIAEELNADNIDRKEIEQEILRSVEKTLEEDENIKYKKIIVVEGEGWHQGVIGIAAARIKDKYGKPTIIITYDGESAKGSGRSIEGFAMCDGVAYCKELLTVFGGHPMAAGMSLKTENIDLFREKINEFADSVENEFFPEIKLACRLNPAAITVSAVEALSLLEPFGAGNPTPVFGIYNSNLTDIRPLGGGKHLKLSFRRDNTSFTALLFGCGPDEFPYVVGDNLNLAVTLDVNEYNNVKSVSMCLKEAGFSDVDYVELMKSKAIFDDLMTGKNIDEKMKKELSVTRDDFVVVYKYLRAKGRFPFSADVLHRRINRKSISLGKLLVILKAMEELGLITMSGSSENLNIDLVKDPPRVEILSAPVLQGLI